jgi:hypothetical protein
MKRNPRPQPDTIFDTPPQPFRETLYEAVDSINTDASTLNNLAAAFRNTGNTIIANELKTISATLKFWTAKLPEAYNQELSREVAEAKARTGAILSSLLKKSEQTKKARSPLKD